MNETTNMTAHMIAIVEYICNRQYADCQSRGSYTDHMQALQFVLSCLAVLQR